MYAGVCDDQCVVWWIRGVPQGDVLSVGAIDCEYRTELLAEYLCFGSRIRVELVPFPYSGDMPWLSCLWFAAYPYNDF